MADDPRVLLRGAPHHQHVDAHAELLCEAQHHLALGIGRARRIPSAIRHAVEVEGGSEADAFEAVPSLDGVAGVEWPAHDARLPRQRASAGRGTAPEGAIRSLLHRRWLRFRVDYPLVGLRGRANLAFPRQWVAVMEDGCFWHGCPPHATWPKENAAWWREKVEGNVARDRDTDTKLVAAGWLGIRVREHENPADAANRVVAALLNRMKIDSRRRGSD